MSSIDSFGAKGHLEVDDTTYEIFRLDAVEGAERLPFSLKVLLENLLRTEDGTQHHAPTTCVRSRRGTPRRTRRPRSSSRPPG